MSQDLRKIGIFLISCPGRYSSHVLNVSSDELKLFSGETPQAWFKLAQWASKCGATVFMNIISETWEPIMFEREP